ncbi:glycosyltransferase family 2 protein [Myxococcota bacterium]|nr:glycosyltransferase family 2 protein [Myxococcota bacterium]
MKVAVCLCTCDREALLRECLAAVAHALRTAPPDAEVTVFVVDNRPGGGAAAVCEALRTEFPCTLQYAAEPERGISFARNRAVAEALAWGADFVAFLDDDDLPDADWLLRLLARQQETDADLVFGTWRWPADFALRPWQRDIKFFRAADFEKRNRFGLPAAAGTFNVAIRSALLERMAADGPSFRRQFALAGGGDTDFFVRAHAGGARHAVALDSRVTRRWEPARTTLLGVLRRAFRVGNTSALQDRETLDEPRWRRKRRRVVLRLARALLVTPWYLLPSRRFARHAFLLARFSGDAYGRWIGGEFRYYDGERSRTPPDAAGPNASSR